MPFSLFRQRYLLLRYIVLLDGVEALAEHTLAERLRDESLGVDMLDLVEHFLRLILASQHANDLHTSL